VNRLNPLDEAIQRQGGAEAVTKRARKELAAPAGRTPQLRDAAALMQTALPPVRYIIPGWLSEGLTMLAANPKVGKSTLILQIAVALTSGGEFWGESVPRAKALMIDLETNERRLRRKLEDAGITTLQAGSLQYSTDWPRGIQGVEAIANALDADPEIRLVVIDTLQRFRDPGAGVGRNAYAADYEAMAPLQSLCRDRPGLAIVVIHHKRKAATDDPIESVNGSSAMTGVVDAIWLLNRKGADDFTLHIQGRDWERDDDEFILLRDNGKWALSDAPRYSKNDAEVLHLLDVAAGMTPTQLGKALGISKQAASQRLIRMKSAQLVRCTDDGVWQALR
jgi:hypothetical protein